MGLKEAFEMVVNTINAKFKEGVYDINDANTIISAINVVGKALSAEKKSEEEEVLQAEPMMEESPKKSTRSKK